MVIKDVTTNIDASNRLHSISPYDLNVIDFMFGEMLYLMTSLAYHVPSAIYHKIPSYILPNTNNKVQGFEGPLHPKEKFHIDAGFL